MLSPALLALFMDLIKGVAAFAVSYSYLGFSRRVRATYPGSVG